MTKILTVDDESGAQFIYTAALEPAGYEVLQAESGREGLQKLIPGIDLVVMDWNCPHPNDGYELVLHARTLGIPCIIITGGTPGEPLPNENPKYPEAREVPVFWKPFSLSVLREKVAEALAKKDTTPGGPDRNNPPKGGEPPPPGTALG